MHLDFPAIGASIRARRTEAALTQAELAERLNITAQASAGGSGATPSPT